MDAGPLSHAPGVPAPSRSAPRFARILAFVLLGCSPALPAAAGRSSAPATARIEPALLALERTAPDETTLVWVSFGCAMAPLVWLLWVVLKNGLPAINADFLSYSMLNVIGDEQGGILHALLGTLLVRAWRRDCGPGTAAVAAALAAVLALAIQTDAIGVPWLAYCLFWLAGSCVTTRRTETWPG